MVYSTKLISDKIYLSRMEILLEKLRLTRALYEKLKKGYQKSLVIEVCDNDISFGEIDHDSSVSSSIQPHSSSFCNEKTSKTIFSKYADINNYQESSQNIPKQTKEEEREENVCGG